MAKLLEFKVSDVHLDTKEVKTFGDALLRVVGRFALVCNNREIYSEEDFCVVEFAGALVNWLRSEVPESFCYHSYESDEACLIRFDRSESPTESGFHIRAFQQKFDEQTIFSDAAIQDASAVYFDYLVSHLPEKSKVIDLLASREQTQELSDILAKHSKFPARQH